LFSVFYKNLNKEAEMVVGNQFNCLFLTRKGNCKQGNKRGKVCRLKNLLSRNGNGTVDKSKLLITFLECYQFNYEKNRKIGESFFRTISKQITDKTLKPLSIYNSNALTEVLKGEKTKNSYMFRIPETWNAIFKSFGI